MKTMLIIAAAAVSLSVPAIAQDQMQGMDMSGMKGMQMKNTPANPFAESEMAMSHKMMMTTGANASTTYAKKMLDHHQGAIDISRIILGNTQDAELKRIAQSTIDENTQGQAKLRAWMARHGG